MDTESVEFVRALLVDILKHGSCNDNVGICCNVEDALTVEWATDVKDSLMKGWPSASGRRGFPIPSGTQGVNAASFFLRTVDGSMWRGNQLMYRRSLLRHMIARLDEDWL